MNRKALLSLIAVPVSIIFFVGAAQAAWSTTTCDLIAPASDPNIDETGNFTMTVRTGATGSGGGYTNIDVTARFCTGLSCSPTTTIGASGGLSTADSNPQTCAGTCKNSLVDFSWTVVGNAADDYVVDGRCNGNNDLNTADQAVTVNAAAGNNPPVVTAGSNHTYNGLDLEDDNAWTYNSQGASFQFSATDADSDDLTATFVFGGVQYSAGEPVANTFTLNLSSRPAGSFDFNYTVTDGTDPVTSPTFALAVSQASSSVTLAPQDSTVTYPATVDEQCDTTNTDSTAAENLYWNLSLVAPRPQFVNPAGTVVYSCDSPATQNFTGSFDNSTLTINQNSTNTVSLTISNSTSAVTDADFSSDSGAETTADGIMNFTGAGTASLYRNGTSVSDPDVQTLAAGSYEYKVNTTGNANYTANATGASFFLFVFDVPDLTPPTISAQSPTNTTYTENSVWANMTLDEAGSHAFRSLDGGANVSMANSTGNWNSLMTGLTNAAHSVRFYANDTSGNEAGPVTVFFTVDVPVAATYTVHWVATDAGNP